MNNIKQKRIKRALVGGGILSLAVLPSAYGLMELGAGAVVAEVNTSLNFDSNIFANNLEEGDIILSVKPVLAYEQSRGLISLRADVGYDILSYNDNDGQDTENLYASLSLGGGFQANAKTKFNVDARYADTETANQEVANIVQQEETVIGGGMDWAFSGKLGLRSAYQYRDLSYANLGFTDSETNTLTLGGLWYYSEKLTVTAGYRYREISYEGGGSDVKTDTLYVGAEGTLTPKVTGTVRFGATDYEGASGTKLFYEVGLDYSLTQKSSLSLVGARDNSASATGDNNLDTTLTLTYNQVLTERFSGFASIGWGTYKRDGSAPRDDDYYRMGAGVKAAINEYASILASFTYESRDSNSAVSEYDRSVAVIAANFKF